MSTRESAKKLCERKGRSEQQTVAEIGFWIFVEYSRVFVGSGTVDMLSRHVSRKDGPLEPIAPGMGDERSLVEVRGKSAKMLDLQRTGLSFGLSDRRIGGVDDPERWNGTECFGIAGVVAQRTVVHENIWEISASDGLTAKNAIQLEEAQDVASCQPLV